MLADLRRWHRIRATLSGALPKTPDQFNGNVTMHDDERGELVIESPDDLAPLLGWLATLPLKDVRVEPLGLRSIYDRYHAAGKEGIGVAID